MKVREIMEAEVPTVESGQPVEDVIGLLRDHGRFAGVVTRLDVLEALHGGD